MTTDIGTYHGFFYHLAKWTLIFIALSLLSELFLGCTTETKAQVEASTQCESGPALLRSECFNLCDQLTETGPSRDVCHEACTISKSWADVQACADGECPRDQYGYDEICKRACYLVYVK